MSTLLRHRFKLLLVSLVGLLLVVPVVLDAIPSGSGVDALVMVGVSTCALLAGMLVIAGKRGALRFALCLLTPSLVLEAVAAVLWHRELSVCHHLLRLVFLGFVIVELFRQLFRPGSVTFDTLSAALCVYLLLGICWAHVFVVLEHVAGESLVIVVQPTGRLARESGEPALFVRMVYFSFVTLTGLAYGDIVPATTTARMFAVMEVLMGQAYLYIMVGRLVGMQVSQALAPQAAGSGPAGISAADGAPGRPEASGGVTESPR
jgi:hypothetical protein